MKILFWLARFLNFSRSPDEFLICLKTKPATQRSKTKPPLRAAQQVGFGDTDAVLVRHGESAGRTDGESGRPQFFRRGLDLDRGDVPAAGFL